MNTWQSELLKELKTQAPTADLNNLITNIEQHQADPGNVAAELRRIGLNYFGDKVEQEFYHIRAKDQNVKDKIKVGDTEVLKEDQSNEKTGRVATSIDPDAVPASEVNKATTTNQQPVQTSVPNAVPDNEPNKTDVQTGTPGK